MFLQVSVYPQGVGMSACGSGVSATGSRGVGGCVCLWVWRVSSSGSRRVSASGFGGGV